jgi:hypothetical protein
MINVRKYIGIPFVDRQASFSGADCYGLLRLFYREEFGRDIADPLLSCEKCSKVFAQYLIEIRKHWKEIEHPTQWCGVAMANEPRLPGVVQHFGIYFDNKILHTLKGVGSHIVQADKSFVNVKKYYAWQQ